MTPEELVLEDALRAVGLERVTVWHLRCVERWLEMEALRRLDLAHGRPSSAGYAESRLRSDLYAGSLDATRAEAELEDVRRMASASLRHRFNRWADAGEPGCSCSACSTLRAIIARAEARQS